MEVEKALQKIENAEVGDTFKVSTEKTKRGETEHNEFELVLGNKEGKYIKFYLAEDLREEEINKNQLPLPTWGEKLEGVPDNKIFPVFHIIEAKNSEEKQLRLHSHEGYSFTHGKITKLEQKGNIFD